MAGKVDYLVIGGGAAGMACAVALDKTGIPTTLIESASSVIAAAGATRSSERRPEMTPSERVVTVRGPVVPSRA